MLNAEAIRTTEETVCFLLLPGLLACAGVNSACGCPDFVRIYHRPMVMVRQSPY